MNHVNGKKVPAGMCVGVDHVVTTFIVKITSLNGTGPNDVKQLLETKYKVSSCVVVDNEVTAMNPFGGTNDL